MGAEVEYPCEVGNLDKKRRIVNDREEHLAHALSSIKGSDFLKLRASKFPIQFYISDDAKLLHSIYVDCKRWGISWLYPTYNDIPYLVKWGLDLISAEYDRLESEELKSSSSSTPQAEPPKKFSR